MSQIKEVHFRLPEPVWREWIRAMPARGERTAFLQRCVGVAVKMMKKREELAFEADRMVEGLVERRR